MSFNLILDPPLLNSSSPWATDLSDLQALYENPFTGAITTRTSLIWGFNDNAEHHQHCFFNAGSATETNGRGSTTRSSILDRGNSSLNTYGYSPIPLAGYISMIKQLVNDHENPGPLSSLAGASPASSPLPSTGERTTSKPIIISVTGIADDIITSYKMITELARTRPSLCLAMEINLSCPNIANKPPPAYSAASLTEYLQAVHRAKQQSILYAGNEVNITVGIKLPPYTYIGQFQMVVDCLRDVTISFPTAAQPEKEQITRSVIDFVTSTNTLGSSLVLDDTQQPALQSESGTGIGGMAGAAVHSLSLGNVATLRRLLNECDETRSIFLIGVGGVSDKAGFQRMRSVGADAVGVATALGRDGIGVFEQIING